MENTQEWIWFYQTEIGRIGIAANKTAVTQITLGDSVRPGLKVAETPLIKNAAAQLRDYLEGKRKEFNFLLEPRGTDFQKSVWRALEAIPYGETRSYKEIAQAIGNPKACRAVGMANNKNPILIVIPCHRVIGSDGSLVGYGAGIDIKEKLLRLEGVK
ncbi:methylated-DNA--[protein]-cysteine S-methyltransferase [Acetobacterium bakii]|uniref:Methylated-DNA--protein-cysteine methyltransferase n=1 Tax=Acetobacterium bakii TaxID=52689 RepID=A0A0L6TW62_9FIRM|nr:methylated-DNA--[protein]-cysteine S-methyltransferase [Acetobacterium bakii]KNZ40493.1 cysteine methyltransferase [Acetobacterium bakii]